MKSFVLISVCVLIIGCVSKPIDDPNEVKVVRFLNDIQEDGGYKFTYELSDGQIRTEAGAIKEVGEEKVIIVSGAYSFVGADGLTYWVNYTADENGYHPVIGTGVEGGIKPGQDAGIDPNALKSLIG